MMNDMVLIAFAVVGALLLLMAIVLVRLWREQKKLKQALEAITVQIHRTSEDVSGLCSAAVSVDRRLAANESRLSAIQEDAARPQSAAPPVYTDNLATEDEPEQGYQLAIEKIRRGASVEDLMKVCGLTRDEAMLLVRLHGKSHG